jgi:endogenous inhibitor of DNA gyrase (YacG/DUF329 family)
VIDLKQGDRCMHDRKITCPICRKEAKWDDNPFRPFCSERCRLIDLGKWASGDYRIAGQDRPPESGEENEKK